jgi:hypothetical protein
VYCLRNTEANTLPEIIFIGLAKYLPYHQKPTYMKRINRFPIAVFLLVMISILTGCQAIGDIFKAGVWVGVLIVAGVIGLILWAVGRSKK